MQPRHIHENKQHYIHAPVQPYQQVPQSSHMYHEFPPGLHQNFINLYGQPQLIGKLLHHDYQYKEPKSNFSPYSGAPLVPQHFNYPPSTHLTQPNSHSALLMNFQRQSNSIISPHSNIPYYSNSQFQQQFIKPTYMPGIYPTQKMPFLMQRPKSNKQDVITIEDDDADKDNSTASKGSSRNQNSSITRKKYRKKKFTISKRRRKNSIELESRKVSNDRDREVFPVMKIDNKNLENRILKLLKEKPRKCKKCACKLTFSNDLSRMDKRSTEYCIKCAHILKKKNTGKYMNMPVNDDSQHPNTMVWMATNISNSYRNRILIGPDYQVTPSELVINKTKEEPKSGEKSLIDKILKNQIWKPSQENIEIYDSVLSTIRDTFNTQRFYHSDFLNVIKTFNNNIKLVKELLDKKDPALMCILQQKTGVILPDYNPSSKRMTRCIFKSQSKQARELVMQETDEVNTT